MKIISWNVNGIRACSKKGLIEFIDREQPDMLCLQETKAHPDQLEQNLIEPFGKKSYFSSAEKKGYSGTVTYVDTEPKSVQHGIGIRKFDSEGRFVVTEHEHFDLYNVYFPNGSASEERHFFKQEFLKKFTKHLLKEHKKGKEIVLVGDYNVAPEEIDVYDPVRLSKVSGFLPEERQWFEEFLDSGFIDTFRFFYPEESQRYSWWSYREGARVGNRGWRIDFVCVTPGLIGHLKGAGIMDQQMGSDHCPVYVELDL